MEPAIGASTWALGNHRCSPYSGAFTMNVIRRARPDRVPVHENVSEVWVSSKVGKCSVPVCVCRWRRVTRRGRELMRV